MAEEFVTIKEAAKLLKVCRETIFRWTRMGILKPLRLGRNIRFRRRDLLIEMEKLEDRGFEKRRPDRPDRPEWS